MRELAKLARHIIYTYPEFYKWYAEKDFTWNKIRQQNRNPLLAMNIGADGLKTGFTNEAGYGLVGSAVQNDMRLIVVVNGLKTANDRADEARRLLNFGFNGFESRVLFDEGQRVGEARVFGGQGALRAAGVAGPEADPVDGAQEPARIASSPAWSIAVRCGFRSQQGQEIAMLKVWRGDNIALEDAAAGCGSGRSGPLHRRAIDATGGIVRRLVPRRPAKAITAI